MEVGGFTYAEHMSRKGAGKIDEYFRLVQKDLKNRFARSRQQNTDSEAKGVAAERIFTKIIKPYLEPSRPTSRRQIIDRFGSNSDEVDVIFCNWSQPTVDTELLLAEGVDYAVGVKSVLTTNEIKSLVGNAASVKRLQRRLGPGETAYASDEVGERLIYRVPYIGFAFESQLTLPTTLERLQKATTGLAPDLYPDALFIMGRGALINSGSVFLHDDGGPGKGWIQLPFPDRVLLEFLNFAIGVVPRIFRNGTALRPYLNDTEV